LPGAIAPAAERSQAGPPPEFVRCHCGVLGHDFRADLTQFDVPPLVIHGEGDHRSCPSASRSRPWPHRSRARSPSS